MIINTLSPTIKHPDLLWEIARRGLNPKYLFDFLKQGGASESAQQALVEPRNTNGGYYYDIPEFNRDFSLDKHFQKCDGPEGITAFHAHPDAKTVIAFFFAETWDFLTWVNLESQRIEEEKGKGESNLTRFPDPSHAYILYHHTQLFEAVRYVRDRDWIKSVRHFHRTQEQMNESTEMLDKLDIPCYTMEGHYEGLSNLAATRIISYEENQLLQPSAQVRSYCNANTPQALLGYRDATKSIVSALKQINNNASSYDNLKEKISLFIEGRQELIDYIGPFGMEWEEKQEIVYKSPAP